GCNDRARAGPVLPHLQRGTREQRWFERQGDIDGPDVRWDVSVGDRTGEGRTLAQSFRFGKRLQTWSIRPIADNQHVYRSPLSVDLGNRPNHQVDPLPRYQATDKTENGVASVQPHTAPA